MGFFTNKLYKTFSQRWLFSYQNLSYNVALWMKAAILFPKSLRFSLSRVREILDRMFSLHTDGTSLPAESCGCIVFCFLGNCGKSFPQTLHLPYLLVRCRSNTTQSTTSLTSLSLPFICRPCLSLIAITFKEKQKLLLQLELQADLSFKTNSLYWGLRDSQLLLLRDVFVIFSSCFLCSVQCFNGSSHAFLLCYQTHNIL